jgi:ribonuclease T2
VRLGALLAAIFLATAPARAGGTPGDFDFYVLSLSWSPTYCATDSHPNPAECNSQFGFVVHGLWPEYESGYPDSCATNMPLSVRQATIDGLADIMPSGGLISHEWRKHGVCSGLTQDAYFATLRKAFEKVSLPGMFSAPQRDASLSPRAIEQAFIAANPRLIETEIAVTCTRGLLDEVRICLTKNNEFRRCPEVDRQSCRATQIKVPAAR